MPLGNPRKRILSDSERKILSLLASSSGLSVYQIAYRSKIDRTTLRKMLKRLLADKEIYRNVVMKKYHGVITMQVSDYNTKYFVRKD